MVVVVVVVVVVAVAAAVAAAAAVVSFISNRMQETETETHKNISKYIKTLLHPASGHQGSCKAYQAGNQS